MAMNIELEQCYSCANRKSLSGKYCVIYSLVSEGDYLALDKAQWYCPFQRIGELNNG